MKTRTIFATLAIPATALGLFAQSDKAADERQFTHTFQNAPFYFAQGAIGGMISHADGLGPVALISQGFSLSGPTVTGAPYSAEEKTETVQTLADGTRITNTSTARVYRDSQGRTRREMILPSLPGGPTPHTLVSIFDPVEGVSLTLDPEAKVAHKMSFPATAGKTMLADKMRAETEAMSRRVAGVSGPNVTYRVLRTTDGQAPQREDLGVTSIEGVNAKGSRETTVIAVGAIGNDRPITVSSEHWESPELQVQVKSVRNDPRVGQTTFTLTNINRAEPDPSLFQVPPDYKLEDTKAGAQRMEVHTRE